jgi:YD repeat-containing protein
VSDVTPYTYSQGHLATLTNALGHITRITAYDAHGRPLTLQDPNGSITEFRYDARGRLLSQSINGSTTSFTYDKVGNLIQITLPTFGFYTYSYDAAHRLTEIQDSLGNRIVYSSSPMDHIQNPTCLKKPLASFGERVCRA